MLKLRLILAGASAGALKSQYILLLVVSYLREGFNVFEKN
jgi:hypothetical protein